MKKIFFAALVAATVFTSAFAADNKKVNSRALDHFKYEFTTAKNVNWSAGTNFTKATFTLDGKTREAFYNYTGELIGTSTLINVTDLPTDAKRTLAKDYEGFNVTEAIRFEGATEMAYYVSVENEKNKFVLKISEDGQVSFFDRLRKN